MIKYPTNSNENKSTNISQANSHKLEGSQYISNENGGDSQWRENEGMNGDMNIMDTVEDSPYIMNDESHVESSQFLDSPCPFFVTTSEEVNCLSLPLSLPLTDIRVRSQIPNLSILLNQNNFILISQNLTILING